MNMHDAKARLLAEYPKGYCEQPGKFEGEPIFAIYYWEMTQNGLADDTLDFGATPVSIYFLTNEDRACWDLPASTHVVAVWESETGFLMHTEWTDAEYEFAVRECENDENV